MALTQKRRSYPCRPSSQLLLTPGLQLPAGHVHSNLPPLLFIHTVTKPKFSSPLPLSNSHSSPTSFSLNPPITFLLTRLRHVRLFFHSYLSHLWLCSETTHCFIFVFRKSLFSVLPLFHLPLLSSSLAFNTHSKVTTPFLSPSGL